MDNHSRNLYIKVETVGALTPADYELIRTCKVKKFTLPKTTLVASIDDNQIYETTLSSRQLINKIKTYLTQLSDYNKDGKVNMSKVLLDYKKYNKEYCDFDMYSEEHSYEEYQAIRIISKLTDLIFNNKIERLTYAYISDCDIQGKPRLSPD